jgi:exodeoxyribonuclease VII large subunit
MAQEYLRISELNELIKDVLHAGFPQPVWICGEIQEYNRNRGKNHIFFELVEKDPDSKNIIAKIGLVLFSGRKEHINDVLKRSENAFALRDDIEVKFACSVDFYPPHGAVRLIVESIDPTYTLGRLAQERQKLIAELKEKGILDKNKQLELPPVPLNIGLVTSDDSAAYHDFCAELRHSGFSFRVFLYNALMQGAKAEKEICRGIEKLSGMEGPKVIVITRGGGSIADLSCFDSRMIAEAIAACPRPVLSGIGHEINLTVTDLAAHTYQKTPTAAAQFLVTRVQAFLDDLDAKLEFISREALAKLEVEQQRLKDNALALQAGTTAYLKAHREKIIGFQEVIRQRPAGLLKSQRMALKEHQKALEKTVKMVLANNRLKITNYQKMVEMVHPANTLKRGFSITRAQNGSILKSIRSVRAQDELTTEVADGLIHSSVHTTGPARENVNDHEGELWLKRNTAGPLKN